MIEPAIARSDCRNDRRGGKKGRRSPGDRDPIARKAHGSGSPGKRVLHTRRGCPGKARSQRPDSAQVFRRAKKRARGKSSTKNKQRGWPREGRGRGRHRVAATTW